jgi:PAS domain-containing protein
MEPDTSYSSEFLMMKKVLSNLPIGLCYVYKREFLWTNEFMLNLTGYTQEELLHQKTRVLYESDEEYERVETQLTTEKAGVITKIIKKGGSQVTVMIHAISNELVDSTRGFQLPLVKTFSIVPDDIAKLITNGCKS